MSVLGGGAGGIKSPNQTEVGEVLLNPLSAEGEKKITILKKLR
jgi:hypothetical protein